MRFGFSVWAALPAGWGWLQYRRKCIKLSATQNRNKPFNKLQEKTAHSLFVANYN